MKKWMFIIFISCILLVVIAEIYTRYFAKHNEPCFDEKSKIIKRVENTSGRYKTGYTNTGYFRINNEGWNSFRDYSREKEVNKFRIAIIGHSNIEGLRVHVNKTVSKVLEDALLVKYKNAEVYAFGFGGMHLAQALHVSRHVMKEYTPDLFIIGTLLDDFFIDYTRHPYFLSLKIEPDSTIKEIIPESMEVKSNSPLSFLYFLKTVQYADSRFHIGEWISRVTGKEKDKVMEQKYSHYFLLQDSVYRRQCLIAIQYLLKEFKKLQIQSQKQFLFLAFPQQVPSYNAQSPIPSYIKSYQEKVIELIKRTGFQVIDFAQPFIEDYKINHEKFDFTGDEHYNEHAHQLIGRTLSDYIINNQLTR